MKQSEQLMEYAENLRNDARSKVFYTNWLYAIAGFLSLRSKDVAKLEAENAALKRWQEDAFEISSNIDLDIERIRKSRGEN